MPSSSGAAAPRLHALQSALGGHVEIHGRGDEHVRLPDSTVPSDRSPRRPADVDGLRVLFVIDGFQLGGAERQALLLARDLTRYGAEVAIWSLFGPHEGPVVDLCNRYGLPSHAIEFDWGPGLLPSPRSLLRLTRVLRLERPDVILPYTACPNLICGSIWRLTGAAGCIWNQRDEGRNRYPPVLEGWAVRQTPCFVANSLHGAEFLVATLGADSRRVHIVPNGIQLDPPDASGQTWRRRLGLTDDMFVACMVANLHRFKDHDTLLRAWRIVLNRLAGRHPTILFLPGRPDTTSEELHTLRDALDLGDSVQFLGPISDVTGFLQAMDLCVFSSRFEGVPNGVLECMAAGLPVVATDIPGIREALGDAGREYLCPPGSAECLADRILGLIDDDQRRAEMGRANQKRVELCFSIDNMVAAMAELITTASRRLGIQENDVER